MENVLTNPLNEINLGIQKLLILFNAYAMSSLTEAQKEVYVKFVKESGLVINEEVVTDKSKL